MKRSSLSGAFSLRNISFILLLLLCACNCSSPGKPSGQANPLPIPPLLKDDDPAPGRELFSLEVRQGTKAFLSGNVVPSYGYNGNYLGPVLRVHRGDLVSVAIQNKIDEATTLHWHGLEVDGAMDGGPFVLHPPGDRWQVDFRIDQPAATLWYHPHPHGLIGKQIYKGLAGLLLIDDEVTDKLPIPKQYGVNDIPLILQDRRFDLNGNMLYKTSQSDVVHGMIGNTMVVNGVVNPYLEVGTRKIRFRLLNGANASTYNISLSDGSQFFQIASDGGLLEAPVPMTSLVLSPGERAEIIVDFSHYKTGTTVFLVSPGFDILKCIISEYVKDDTVVPRKLASIEKISASLASTTRTFVLSQQGSFVAINGQRFSPDRIDENVKAGATEIWDIYNAGMGGMMGGDMNFGGGHGMSGPGGFMGHSGMMGGMGHPFHIHSVQFQLLERDGQQPPPGERGWKDTVLLNPGEEVKVIARFMHTGKFVYHCHILEHDDLGMMGAFVVE
jgi:FtsP/CotA-like multicopper oxidase with cupredoxin domain